MQADEQPDRSQLFTLVTKPKREPHKWYGGDMIPRSETLSGHEQREWRCAHCPLVKVTVLARDNVYRAYRVSETTEQFVDEVEPECRRAEAAKEVKAS